MIALFNATNGESWKRSENWLSPKPIGEWEGVKTDLYFYENRLSGEIPAELGNLSSLRALILHSNQLSGEIPPEMGNLSSLQELYLGVNRLSGEIPPEMGNLSSLETLYLQMN